MAVLRRGGIGALAALALLAAPAAAHLDATTSSDPFGVRSLGHPATESFGGWAVGTTSTVHKVLFTNTNTDSSVIPFGASIDGTNPRDFTIVQDDCSRNSDSALGPGQSCFVRVSLKPSAPGARVAVLHVPDSQSDDNTVNLRGSGTVHLAHTPTSLSFGSQAVATTSSSQKVTFTNDQAAGDVTISSVTITGTNAGDFARTNNCGATVAPGASCTVDVTFTPTAAGARAASLQLVSNSTSSPDVIPLDGTGTVHLAHSPSSLAFGNQAVATTSASKTVTFNNDQAGDVSISSVTTTGTNASDFAPTNNCPATLTSGASCTVDVTFTPGAAGARSASLKLVSNSTGSPDVIALTGTGTVHLAHSPASLSFGNQTVGITSASKTVTFTNDGGGSVAISSVTLTGANAGDFARTNNCPATVTAGNSCTVDVTFTPGAAGARAASLRIVSTSTTSPDLIPLDGTGTVHLAHSPASLSFGNQGVSTTSAKKTVTFTNDQAAGNVSISSVTTTGTNAGDFAPTNNCTATLAPGASCTVDVTFTPGAAGARTASLRLASNSTTSPDLVPLDGNGTVELSHAPASLSFGDQPVATTSAKQTVTFTNNQVTGDVTISSVTIAGTNTGDFARTTNCPATLTPGSSCTVDVTFAPTTVGARTAQLRVVSNSTSSPDLIPLTGNGTVHLAHSPSSLPFGNQTVGQTSGSKTVTFTNDGGGSVAISSVAVTGTNAGDFAPTNNCPATLTSGSSCTVDLTFTPGAAGARSASLKLVSNSTGSPDVIALTGTGTVHLDHSPSSLSFGDQAVTTTSASKSVTFINDQSAGDVTISTVTITGTNSGDFADTEDCATTLHPGDSCVVDVTFSPSAAGARTASLRFASDSTTSPDLVPLDGNGTVELSHAPATLSFGNQAVGTPSAKQTVTFTNNQATGDVTISSVTIAGANPGDFARTNHCPATLTPDNSCTVDVTFTPTTAGPLTAQLKLVSNSTGSPDLIPLTGNGTVHLAHAPGSLAFGDQLTNTQSAAQTVTFTNDQTLGDVTIGPPLSLSGANADQFVIGATNCTHGGVLTPTHTCTANVAFAPTAPGTKAASLNLTSNSIGSPDVVALSGNGTTAPPQQVTEQSTAGPAPGSGPLVGFDLTELAFGPRIVAGVQDVLVLTLHNTGDAPLIFTTLSLGGPDAGDFTLTDGGARAKPASGCVGAVLPPGWTCAVRIAFVPGQPGPRNASLLVSDNAPGSPQTIPLTGSGLPPPVLYQTANAEPVSGEVTVSIPGAAARAAGGGLKGRKFIPLREARQVPLGSIFNTRRGRVRVATATLTPSISQVGEFFAGYFQLLQKRSERSLTDARLLGGNFSACAAAAPKTGKTTARAAKKKVSKKVIRLLKASVKGKFRTSGRFAAATVRGTEWGMTDRCDGTLTRVQRGTVVVRDKTKQRNVVVRTGKSFLVPKR